MMSRRIPAHLEKSISGGNGTLPGKPDEGKRAGRRATTLPIWEASGTADPKSGRGGPLRHDLVRPIMILPPSHSLKQWGRPAENPVEETSCDAAPTAAVAAAHWPGE